MGAVRQPATPTDWSRRGRATPGSCAPDRRIRTRRRPSPATDGRSARASARPLEAQHASHRLRADSVLGGEAARQVTAAPAQLVEPTSLHRRARAVRPVDGTPRPPRVAHPTEDPWSSTARAAGSRRGPKRAGQSSAAASRSYSSVASRPHSSSSVTTVDASSAAGLRNSARAPSGVTCSWMPCWLPSWRITAGRVQTADQRVEPLGALRSIGQPGQLERRVEGDDEREVVRRQPHVLAGRSRRSDSRRTTRRTGAARPGTADEAVVDDGTHRVHDGIGDQRFSTAR